MNTPFQMLRRPLSGAVRHLRDLGRVIRGKKPKAYLFERMDPALNKANEDVAQICNLLNYTKTSNSTYNGQNFPAGYHTFDINGFYLQGQRNPAERLVNVPFDFNGKTVLDIGCNQGGMLYTVAGQIKHGVGIDFDARVVNAANRIRVHTNSNHINFYVFNVEDEPLDLIRDFIPKGKVDIAFLLAVCMWIKNWREVIDFVCDVSTCLLFESNGSPEQQNEQIEYLKTKYRSVDLLAGQSLDDLSQKSRRLYFCQ